MFDDNYQVTIKDVNAEIYSRTNTNGKIQVNHKRITLDSRFSSLSSSVRRPKQSAAFTSKSPDFNNSPFKSPYNMIGEGGDYEMKNQNYNIQTKTLLKFK